MLVMKPLSQRMFRANSWIFIAPLLALLLLLSTLATASASAAQTTPNSVKRVFAAGNQKIDIDKVDDNRVDVDIAVLDTGIDLENSDLNVVMGVNCLGGTPGNGYSCVSGGPGVGDDDSGHGTMVSKGIAAIDNDHDEVGVAPGARLWAIKVADKKLLDDQSDGIQKWFKGEAWQPAVFNLDPQIAGVKWVIAHASQIEVMHLSAPCTTIATPPVPQPVCVAQGDTQRIETLETAITEAINKGVVVVTPAGNWRREIKGPEADSIPARHANLITVSAITDTDGLPGGKGELGKACKDFFSTSDKDDTDADTSHYGAGIDVTAPGPCTSSAAPHASGAAAILASIKNPGNAAEVKEIRDTIVKEGNTNPSSYEPDPGWNDESGDKAKEPLIDLGNEAVFAPKMTPGSVPSPVDSDVTGDGKADLVSLRHTGVVYVYAGNGEAKFATTGKASFESYPLDPAQFDGEGHYVVDVTDVTGEKRSDLITLRDDGRVTTYSGETDGSFSEAGISELGLDPGLLKPGGVEPIAVADVNGGGRGDLIVYDDSAAQVKVYLGQAAGNFGPAAIVARSGIYSALHTDSGHHFVDAADVTGDNRADLVSIGSNGDLNVFAGQPDGTFAAPVLSQKGTIDPAMDNGSGYEPIGLGDVTGDSYADLALVKSGTVYLYPGSSAGSFGTAATSFAGAGTSTTFGSGFVQFIGLLNVNGDSYVDIAGVLSSNGKPRVVPGQASGVFATAATTEATLPTTQHLKNQNSTGNEFVSEKPSWRRQGCSAEKCPAYADQPLFMFDLGGPCNPCNDTGFEGFISTENLSYENFGGCDVDFDLQVQYLGDVGATNVKTSNCYYGMATALACELPWPGEIRLTHAGEIKVNLSTCLKGAFSGPVYHELTYLTDGQESELGTGIEDWEQISSPDYYYPFGIDDSEFEDHNLTDSVRLWEEE